MPTFYTDDKTHVLGGVMPQPHVPLWGAYHFNRPVPIEVWDKGTPWGEREQRAEAIPMYWFDSEEKATAYARHGIRYHAPDKERPQILQGKWVSGEVHTSPTGAEYLRLNFQQGPIQQNVGKWAPRPFPVYLRPFWLPHRALSGNPKEVSRWEDYLRAVGDTDPLLTRRGEHATTLTCDPAYDWAPLSMVAAHFVARLVGKESYLVQKTATQRMATGENRTFVEHIPVSEAKMQELADLFERETSSYNPTDDA